MHELKVEIENLYKTILDLHYIRNALFDNSQFEKSADYIEGKFKEYGLHTESQTFTIESMDCNFKNIIAVLNPGKSHELLITSHYDHIFNSVGADDNLSGVSVMLEVARILSTLNINITIKFISFTLEEGHSGYIKMITEKGEELGLLNPDGIPSTYKTRLFLRKIQDYLKEGINEGYSIENSLEKFIHTYGSEFTPQEQEYLQFRSELRKKNVLNEYKSYQSFMGLIGSTYFVEKNKETLSNIRGVINFETCGYTSKERSQILPKGLDPKLFPQNDIKDIANGDYIVNVGEKYSLKLGSSFFENTIGNLPSLLLTMPLDYNEISKSAKDLLRSDHAPFWKEHIPALMITDTANFRNPYYHTPGDTIETLDFEFLEKITQVTIKTILDQNNNS